MINFKILKTGEIKSALSLRTTQNRTYIRFTEGGKEYGYSNDNIEILDTETTKSALPFTVYTLKKVCYKCNKETDILTYITYADNESESLKRPWNKERLLKSQDIFSHLQDPSIEYYGLNVIGNIEEYDNMLLSKYPDRIKLKYSNVKKKTYPMNVCTHCGAKQGWYYVYREVNKLISDNKKIDILDE